MRRGLSLLVLLGTCLCASDYELADAGGWKKLYKHHPGYGYAPPAYGVDPWVYGPAAHGPFAPLVAHYYYGYGGYGDVPGCSLPACSLPVCSQPVCSQPVCSLPVCSLPVCSLPACSQPVCSLPATCSCACSAPWGGVGGELYVPQTPTPSSPTPSTQPSNPGTTYVPSPVYYQNPALLGAVTLQPQATTPAQMTVQPGIQVPQQPMMTYPQYQYPVQAMPQAVPAVPQITAAPQLTVIPQSHSYYAPLPPLATPIPAVPAVEEIAW